jgi:hypothetical protein
MSRLNKFVKVFKNSVIFDDRLRLKSLSFSVLQEYINYQREFNEDNNLFKGLTYEEIEDILKKIEVNLINIKFKEEEELILYIDEIIYYHFNK